MTTLNAPAVAPMQAAGIKAATDVTGFGLLGHLREVAIASGVGAILNTRAVPILGGVRELVEAGVYAGGSERNFASVHPFIVNEGVDEPMVRILADAQTSGGLLISVSKDKADGFAQALAEAGSLAVAFVGEVVSGPPKIVLR